MKASNLSTDEIVPKCPVRSWLSLQLIQLFLKKIYCYSVTVTCLFVPSLPQPQKSGFLFIPFTGRLLFIAITWLFLCWLSLEGHFQILEVAGSLGSWPTSPIIKASNGRSSPRHTLNLSVASSPLVASLTALASPHLFLRASVIRLGPPE